MMLGTARTERYAPKVSPVSQYRDQYVPHAVVIAEYDPDWPVRFRAEKRLLQVTSNDSLHSVEHVGSTSVPALAAKPVIDIMGGVVRLTDADSLIESFEAIGYQYVPPDEDAIPDRRYFRKPICSVRQSAQFHLHVAEVGGEFWTKHLLFRDYLQGNPARANDYASLKRRLADEYKTDRLGYSQAKTVSFFLH